MVHVLPLVTQSSVTPASLLVPGLVVVLLAVLGVLLARPVARRRHARLVGGTVADLQRLVGDARVGDVLPSRGRRANGRTAIPLQGSVSAAVAALPTSRLVDLVGADHPVTGVGRHRRGLARAGRALPARTPDGYWDAYLQGVDLPVASGAGERFFAAEEAAVTAAVAAEAALEEETTTVPVPDPAPAPIPDPAPAAPPRPAPAPAGTRRGRLSLPFLRGSSRTGTKVMAPKPPAALRPDLAAAVAASGPADGPGTAAAAPAVPPAVPPAPPVAGPADTPSEETMTTPAEQDSSRWYDAAPDGRSHSRRSAVMARAEGGDAAGWWNADDAADEQPAAPAEDDAPAPGSFWGTTALAAPRPAGRPVAVVDLAAAPTPLPLRRPVSEPQPTAVVEHAPVPVAAPEPVVEPDPEPEPEAAVEQEPEPVAVEPEPVAEPPALTFLVPQTPPVVPQPAVDLHPGPEPDPEPQPVAVGPEPEPLPADPAPEPVAVEPEPAAVAPEPAVEPEPVPLPAPHPFAGELAHPDASHAVPHPRGHRQPSPRQRQVLREASLRFEHPTDRFGIAQVATEEALALVEADIASLVVRSVEGPRVLRQDPEGMGIWGAKTLAALMNLGRPLRKVIEGDPLSGGGQTALLVVPVPAAGTVAGTLVVRRTTGRAFSPAEQDCLERLARMAGAALDTAARRGMLVGQGRLDPVTGLAHRDRLVEDLRAALLTSQTHGMPTSLLAAEVAGLAELREAQGRPAADEAVAALAAALTGTLRVGDVPYRFGLDEFAVLLPATQEEDAPAAAARLCAAIDALDLRPGGRRLRLRAAVVPVTGVAEDVVLRAIRALAAAERPTVEA